MIFKVSVGDWKDGRTEYAKDIRELETALFKVCNLRKLQDTVTISTCNENGCNPETLFLMMVYSIIPDPAKAIAAIKCSVEQKIKELQGLLAD